MTFNEFIKKLFTKEKAKDIDTGKCTNCFVRKHCDKVKEVHKKAADLTSEDTTAYVALEEISAECKTKTKELAELTAKWETRRKDFWYNLMQRNNLKEEDCAYYEIKEDPDSTKLFVEAVNIEKIK